ncbi:MAG: signal recognition particle-docking protein FtsY [Candidatus Pacearchaeota archaeon]
MFGFLKNKLKEWLKKTKESEKQESEKSKTFQSEAIQDETIQKPESSFFQKIFKGLTTFKLTEPAFEEFFSELETILIENNVAIEAIDNLKAKLKEELLNKEIKKKEIEQKIKEALKRSMLALLLDPFDLEAKIKESKKPFVIVFFGINGSGKTTTIAKIAYLLKKKHLSCVFAASDTFRAASIEQLEKHAQVLQIPIIKSKYGADPASVAFDAIAHAKAHLLDVVLIDTAGRMHTKKDLLREMEKICRVAKPDLKIFVGEAIAGNDAIEQARNFNDAIGIDAIILTKADVDERGGACISVGYITKKPILFLGTGQNYEDLEIFDKNKIVEKIFE